LKSGATTVSGGAITNTPTKTTTAAKKPNTPVSTNTTATNGRVLTVNQRNQVQQAYEQMAQNDPDAAEAYKNKIEI
jgi:hypothetical protein